MACVMREPRSASTILATLLPALRAPSPLDDPRPQPRPGSQTALALH